MSKNTALRWVLHIEALLLAVLSISLYRYIGGSWTIYFSLWLIPDVFMLGYLVNAKVGALLYNTSHNLVLPLIMAASGWYFDDILILQLALLWVSHVAIDRTLGYGLKYSSGFRDTHFGRI